MSPAAAEPAPPAAGTAAAVEAGDVLDEEAEEEEAVDAVAEAEPVTVPVAQATLDGTVTPAARHRPPANASVAFVSASLHDLSTQQAILLRKVLSLHIHPMSVDEQLPKLLPDMDSVVQDCYGHRAARHQAGPSVCAMEKRAARSVPRMREAGPSSGPPPGSRPGRRREAAAPS